MRELVALALPPGQRFIDELRRAWERGDAVLPVDLRLPPAEVDRLFDAVRPARIITEDGRVARAGSRWVEPDDALVVATSGTTGQPKGVVLTHEAIRASARATSERLGIDPFHHAWLCCLPVAHIGGLSVITRSIITGCRLEVHPRFDPEAAMASTRRGVTHTSLVAAALARIDASLFDRILLGGAAPPKAVPENCVVTYGMTETGSGIWYDDAPIDGAEVDVRDGEIHVRGPMLLRAYRFAEEDVDPKDAEGWFATGDAGAWHDETNLRVHGRRGFIIVTGGEKVWPEMVERVLVDHPAIAEVLVHGEADDTWGHRVVADIVVAPDASAPSLDDVRAFARDELAPYALPREVRVVPALARTPLGKLRRA